MRRPWVSLYAPAARRPRLAEAPAVRGDELSERGEAA